MFCSPDMLRWTVYSDYTIDSTRLVIMNYLRISTLVSVLQYAAWHIVYPINSADVHLDWKVRCNRDTIAELADLIAID